MGLLGIGLVAVAAVWLTTAGMRAWTSEGLRRLRVTEAPPLLTPLALISPAGEPIVPWGGDAPANQVLLVTFIYTRCPTLCSTAGVEFSRLQRELDADPEGGAIRLLSVSFDSLHDDVAALRTYAANHRAAHDRWLVTAPATSSALARLLREAGVVVISDGRGGYAHNAAIHVVLADGRLVGIFDLTDGEEALASARQWGR